MTDQPTFLTGMPAAWSEESLSHDDIVERAFAAGMEYAEAQRTDLIQQAVGTTIPFVDRAAEVLKPWLGSGRTALNAAQALADAGLLTPAPRIQATRDHLAQRIYDAQHDETTGVVNLTTIDGSPSTAAFAAADAVLPLVAGRPERLVKGAALREAAEVGVTEDRCGPAGAVWLEELADEIERGEGSA